MRRKLATAARIRERRASSTVVARMLATDPSRNTTRWLSTSSSPGSDGAGRGCIQGKWSTWAILQLWTERVGWGLTDESVGVRHESVDHRRSVFRHGSVGIQRRVGGKQRRSRGTQTRAADPHRRVTGAIQTRVGWDLSDESAGIRGESVGLRHESVNHRRVGAIRDTGRLEFRDASAESEPSRWSQTRVSGPTDWPVRFRHGSVGIQR